VELAPGYLPAETDVFRLMDFPRRAGAFDNVASGGRLVLADAAGSFRVDYAGTALVLSDFQAGDLDGDGLNDAWALDYFGLTPLAAGSGPNDLLGDKDGDGVSNYAEYVAGTNPTNAASLLQLRWAARPGAVAFEFDWVLGKTYQVLFSADLVHWTPIVSPAFTTPRHGVLAWTDDGSQTGGAPAGVAGGRFYRVSVR
jgi:hypothetical protein